MQLAPLNPSDKQSVFDHVATHLLTQRVPARSASGMCQYRGPNGTKCAVGYLIPDSDYRPEWEGSSIQGRELYLVGRGFSISLLSDLQGLHDQHSPAAWKRILVNIADAHELSTDVVNSLPEID